ncbi:MAG TPA: helix-turn-helix transcriptional regulator [Actinomycetota bacterium]|nr:helix-turn-helix transcriptional regulator [Actinomycetota bacterium]
MNATDATSPGRRLRDLRIAKGWNQTRLAARAKVSIGTISFAERGIRQPQELTQERIARALGVDRREIWPDSEPAKEAS